MVIRKLAIISTYQATRPARQQRNTNLEIAIVTTLRPNGYDSNLKWEETASFNVGLDYGILKGRVSGSLEFYQKNTKDLLFERTVPSGSNLTNIILSNIGEFKNTGVELTVNTVAISKADLNWNISR